MPYVGRDLQRGNYLKLDDISSSFNGSTTTFNLTSGGSAFFPGSAFSIIVSLGGVVQEPEAAFQIDRSQIIFATAPSPNDDFFCIVQGMSLGIGVPGHNTVGNDHLAKPLSYGDYFRWDSANNRVGINTLLPSTALDVVGDASFSGNVAIGGTLTYEDVTNIDSVGIITARAGIKDETLTTGHVVFTGTDGRLIGEKELFYNTSNNRLGIGTNNPNAQLDVYKTGTATVVDVFMVRSTTGAFAVQCSNVAASNPVWALRTYSAEDLVLSPGGNANTNEKVRIRASDGFIGINTTTPSKLVTIKADAPYVRLEAQDSSDKRLDFEVTNTGIATVSATQSSQQLSLKSVGGEIRLDASGRVGINSSTPANTLVVREPTDNNTSVQLFRASTGGDIANITWATNQGNQAKINYRGATPSGMQFYTGGSASSNLNMLIDPDGKVGIGTDEPAYQVDIVGDGGLSVSALTNSTHGQLSIVGRNSNSSVSAISRLKSYPEGSSNQSHLAVETRNNSNSMVEAVRISATQQVGVGTISPKRKVDIVGNSILVRPTADNISSSGNGSAVNNSIIVRMPYGENPASTNHGGARFGIQFTGANNTTDVSSLNFGDDPVKSASIYGVSEDNLGYNRKIGLAFYTSGFDATQTEKLRITADGEVGISPGSVTPTAGDLQTGDSQNKPLIHVKGNGVSATGGEYNLLGRFEAGGDANDTGAMIVLNHSNDRGLALVGGRGTDNKSFGAIKSIDNTGRLTNVMAFGGENGQGVEYLKFYTGDSTTTEERLSIGSNGGTMIQNAGTLGTSTNETLYIQGEGHNGHGTTNTRSVVSITGAITSNTSAAGLWIGARTNTNTAVIGTRTSTGNLAFETYSGGWGERMRLTYNGSLNIGGDFSQSTYTMKVTGSFAATTKSFVIDHPTKENHTLRYACLEGPENSVYVRGKTSDSVIELPDYWQGLVHDDSITVNVTPIGNHKVWVESINNNSVTIGSDGSEYFYTVFAERKDVDKLEVEVAK